MNIVDILGFMFGKLLPALVFVWLASVVVAICCLAKEDWHHKARWYLCWALFPFPIIIHPRRFGFFRSWMLFFVSPCMVSVYYAILMFFALMLSMGYTSHGIPDSVPYHNAQDLKRITGVDFPEVLPIDSTYYDSWGLTETTIKFVPLKSLRKTFYEELEKACVNDSCCWTKDSTGYYYYIYPERPIDRTKGTHIRQVELDGEMVPDWDGDFIEVFVPFKGDTIIVNEGWCL